MQITDEQIETSIAALKAWRKDKTINVEYQNAANGEWFPLPIHPDWVIATCVYRLAPTQAQKDEEAFLGWFNANVRSTTDWKLDVKGAWHAALAYARK